MELLVRLAGRPFLLFEALGKAYQENGMNQRKHARGAAYEFLDRQAEIRFPEFREEIRGRLTMDYYLRENAKKRPDFCGPEMDRELERKILAEHNPSLTMKQLLGRYHVEKIGGELWIFDYENRDILTGNAGIAMICLASGNLRQEEIDHDEIKQ